MRQFGVVVVAQNVSQIPGRRLMRIDVSVRINESHRLERFEDFLDEMGRHKFVLCFADTWATYLTVADLIDLSPLRQRPRT